MEEIPRIGLKNGPRRTAARHLGTDLHELIVFEDAVSAVKTARSAGVMFVGIDQHDRAAILVDTGASYVVPDFEFPPNSDVWCRPAYPAFSTAALFDSENIAATHCAD